MGISVTPIPRLTTLTTPAFTLGTANAAGDALTAVASNSTLLSFDTTAPDAITFGQSGAVGAATVAPRRDHAHAMPANPANLVVIGTVAADDSATLTVTGLDTTYATYVIELSNMIAAADGEAALIRVGDSGGIKSGATDYGYISDQFSDGSTTPAISVSTGVSSIPFAPYGVGNAAGEGLSARFELHSGSVFPLVTGLLSYVDSNMRAEVIFGQLNTVITLTQVQFRFGAANVTSGRMTVWGMNHE